MKNVFVESNQPPDHLACSTILKAFFFVITSLVVIMSWSIFFIFLWLFVHPSTKWTTVLVPRHPVSLVYWTRTTLSSLRNHHSNESVCFRISSLFILFVVIVQPRLHSLAIFILMDCLTQRLFLSHGTMLSVCRCCECTRNKRKIIGRKKIVSDGCYLPISRTKTPSVTSSWTVFIFLVKQN